MVSSNGKRRRNLVKAQHKKALKTAAKKELQFLRTLPQIREDDLLAFQFAHFGDDSRPEKWFVTPEEAINFEPEYEDLLGYYDDGVKRTLTDEEIAVFRRRELWDLQRSCQAKIAEAAEGQSRGLESETNCAEDLTKHGGSPLSDVSSLEDVLISHAAREKMHHPQQPHRSRSIPSQSSRSGTVISTDSIKRRRLREVPYDERHKRNWESYIEENDPLEGSLTHRRMARELDNLKQETFEMDY